MKTGSSGRQRVKATKNGSGSPIGNAPEPPVSQKRWRAVGLICLCAAALAAWAGAEMGYTQGTAIETLLYTGVVLLLLAAAIYTVALDIRYTRLQYAVARRAVFLETLGDETFRASLRGISANTVWEPGESEIPDNPDS